MRIATYNLRSGGSEAQWQRILSLDLDILLLQEFNPNKFTPPGQLLYATTPHGQWGSAIWLKQGTLEKIPLPEFDGWVVGAKVKDLDWGNDRPSALQIFSIHAPTSPKGQSSNYPKQVNAILDSLLDIANQDSLVLAGDFNLTIGLRHQTERKDDDLKLMTRFRRDFGLINCWQTANPNQNLPQTLRWSGDKTCPYHCDGIFAPAAWYRHLEACQVLSDETWETFSDHNPVVATFS